jgi:cystathionine gamma-lyase
MAERRARWGTDDVPEGTVRLSVGCERIEDLLKGFEKGLLQLKEISS